MKHRCNLNRRRRNKRKGFIVKGITKRHWWGFYDKDMNSSRAQVKRDTFNEIMIGIGDG